MWFKQVKMYSDVSLCPFFLLKLKCMRYEDDHKLAGGSR
jgi:hypothetical protein